MCVCLILKSIPVPSSAVISGDVVLESQLPAMDLGIRPQPSFNFVWKSRCGQQLGPSSSVDVDASLRLDIVHYLKLFSIGNRLKIINLQKNFFVQYTDKGL
jgi:hypothetical protein